jgi:hypothetical protein
VGEKKWVILILRQNPKIVATIFYVLLFFRLAAPFSLSILSEIYCVLLRYISMTINSTSITYSAYCDNGYYANGIKNNKVGFHNAGDAYSSAKDYNGINAKPTENCTIYKNIKKETKELTGKDNQGTNTYNILQSRIIHIPILTMGSGGDCDNDVRCPYSIKNKTHKE